MKKLGLLFLFMAFAAMSFGQGISGSAHDFSLETWNTEGEICNACHTPHTADISVVGSPLWNHEVTVATYTLYSSGTLHATPGQPSGTSKLCLSCHDGTVALDSYGGATGATTIDAAFEVSDLATEHPISFLYQDAIDNGDTELNATTATVTGVGTVADLLFTGSMECGSCHDVHNSDGNTNLLRVNNTGSNLCLACHNK